MTRSNAIVRFLLFCLFFGTGSFAITLAILAEEIQTLYINRDIHRQSLQTSEKIKSLTAEYEAQIEQIKKDPDLLKKLERITFGNRQQSVDSETEYPTARLQELQKASKALQEPPDEEHPANIDRWITRSAIPSHRMALFASGAALVLTAFIFFDTEKTRRPKHHRPQRRFPSFTDDGTSD